MSPDPVNWTALDRSTYATATPGGDPFYVEPPSVQPGLRIGEYRRRREANGRRPRALGRAECFAAEHTRRRRPIALMVMLAR
jgi:hypothetical protein